MSNKRRNHLSEFKAKVALAAAKGDKTTAEMGSLSIYSVLTKVQGLHEPPSFEVP
ncbi:MAG: hypothetical protein ACI9FJ_002741 [Alteromonadaceae bacterium]|jgi:hypothetical protein